MRITIDGNIGVGKSTILKSLKDKGYNVTFENVKAWDPWLKKYYNNPGKYALPLQLRILKDQHKYQYIDRELNFYERSPYTLDKVFGDMLHRDGLLDSDEINLHNNYVDLLGWKPDYIIYIYSSPEVCKNRINQRNSNNLTTNNKKNTEGVTYEYLVKLHTQHEKVFDSVITRIPIYKINGDNTFDNVYDNINNAIEDIKSHNRNMLQ